MRFLAKMSKIQKIIIENHVEDISICEALDYCQAVLAEGKTVKGKNGEFDYPSAEFRLDGISLDVKKDENVDKLVVYRSVKYN